MSNAFMCVTNGRAAAPPCWVCSIGVSISMKPLRWKFSRSARTSAGARAAPCRGPPAGRSGRRTAAGPAPPRTARRPRTGWAAGAATWPPSATRRRAPTARRAGDAITRPCTNRWSPRSTSALNAASALLADRGQAEHHLQPVALAVLQRREAELAGVAHEHHAAGDADHVVRLLRRPRGPGAPRAPARSCGCAAPPTGYASTPAASSRSRFSRRTRICSGASSAAGVLWGVSLTGRSYRRGRAPAGLSSRRCSGSRSSARSRIGDECVSPPTDR